MKHATIKGRSGEPEELRHAIVKRQNGGPARNTQPSRDEAAD